jgi:spermidine synthase
MEAQASFALIPLLHTPARERALVLGYGTGMTARVLHEASFQQIEIAELSRDLVRLADKHFESINHGVSSMDGVRMHFTDGRNLLLTQDVRYDLISIEISSIWFAGAANLYNKDFYDLARTRLAPRGVLQQWVQLHHMSQLDLLHILGSVRAAFPHVWVYFSGGQGVIVASLERDEGSMKRARESLAQTTKKHPHWGLEGEDLQARLLASPEQLDAILRRFDPSGMGLVSTDNNLYLEYATPKGNAIRSDTVPGNVGMLRGAW